MPWTEQESNDTEWSEGEISVKSFILKEDEFYLLLEDGGKIIIEPQRGAEWAQKDFS